MELILQQGLPHQQKAVDAVCSLFDGINISAPSQFYENPKLDITDSIRLSANVVNIQNKNKIPAEYRSGTFTPGCLCADIKMETGTGKTYVYTKTIFELHKKYGINKFVIVVPSLPIKAGTSGFLTDEYARRHFSDACGYNTDIEIGVLEATKRKKGKQFFPSVVRDFVSGSCQSTKKIYVLLVNMQLLTGTNMLSRDDYDYGVHGFYRPFDAISATKPFVILDEPHRFSRTQKAYKVITEEIKPQCLIRFGATFPETTSGRGKNKITVKDYQNLLYDLNACESFNKNLIKGVAKEHFEPISGRDEKIKITTIDNRTSVTFQYKKRDEATKSVKLTPGDSLSVIHNAFEGITIDGIKASSVVFSNGIEKSTGEEMDVEIYMTSYQEQMLRLALQRHFETERENFCGRNFKIKTLALFFIDDISSYRYVVDGKEPYLLKAFEHLLAKCISDLLEKLTEYETEYKEYLKASLADISACHAGYFAQDNDDSDENIAKEVDDILRNKKQLLSFKNPDGSYNTRRFLFSKWTLKEGWDNPNVFTIAKLRSSGSDNSKLQEVGRGLRLPVDENGNRISNEEFQLNYIVDFTDADFAQKLIEQINGELPEAQSITEDRLEQVAKKFGINPDELFDALYDKRYIDRHMKIKPENRDAFYSEYPEFATGLSGGKVKDLNKKKTQHIKIRSDVYNDIRGLWETINQRYLLYYDPELEGDIESAVLDIFEKGIFTEVVMSSSREVVDSSGNEMTLEIGAGVQYNINRPISYGEFLKRIMKATNVPIATIHKAMCSYVNKKGAVESRYINESSASTFIHEFVLWKNENTQGKFNYVKSNTPLGATALTFSDGTPRNDIAQGRIGAKIKDGIPVAKYLYDAYAYDSPLELENITADIEKVVVYGKIPRCSIAIPTTTGGMYSPDFMYVVKKSSGEQEVNIVVETKDVEGKSQLRGEEEIRINCAEVFFKKLSEEGYNVHFHTQISNKKIRQIITDTLAGASNI